MKNHHGPLESGFIGNSMTVCASTAMRSILIDRRRDTGSSIGPLRTKPASMATNPTSPFIQASSIQIPSLADTYGAFFIGSCVSLVLYGLTVHQTYRYFRLYPGDPMYLKALVVTVFLAETLNAILPVHLCYYHLVANYFNPLALLDDTLSLRLLAPTSTVTILACQSFYLRRVFLVDRRYQVIVAGTVALLVIEAGFAIALSVQAFKGRQMQDFAHLTWIVSVFYGVDMVIDTILAGTLIVYLLRNRTGTERNDSMIQTLIVYTINTGLVTSIVAMLSFIFGLIMPGNLVYFAMGIVVTKSYANSVLALLNTRRYLSNEAIDAFDGQSIMFNNAVCTHCSTIQRGTAPEVAVSLPTSGDSGIMGESHTDLQECEMRFRVGGNGADSATSSKAVIKIQHENAVNFLRLLAANVASRTWLGSIL
ncbi:hypothetical protein LXA43DRAFT_754429 [Ganoderma leucocontextum]|nr:hypothetical protein LXA43DRAFT_754429 [Ganoderma leucocontextum]